MVAEPVLAVDRNPFLLPLSDLVHNVALLLELLDLDADLEDEIMGRLVSEIRIQILQATLAEYWPKVGRKLPAVSARLDLAPFLSAISATFDRVHLDPEDFLESVRQSRREWDLLPAWFTKLWETIK